MATSDKYDRQLRLWGAMGQRKLMSTNLLLLNAGPTGSETLKNLVLPGIGTFEICDGATVCEADLGNNFFVTDTDVGRSRAQVPRMLVILDPMYIQKFNMIVATQLAEPALSALAATCQSHAIPLLIVHSFGLLGYVRLQVPNHTIVDSKPDAPFHDLRIAEPFPELLSFANEFNLETMNSHEHGHVPYVIILIQSINEWKAAHGGDLPKTFVAKNEFKALVQAKARGSFGQELNFSEAVDNAFKAYTLTKDAIPDDVRDVLAHASTMTLTASTATFWFIARALAGFVAAHGSLPHSGHVPDMTSFTAYYVTIQKLYSEKAKSDAHLVFNATKQLLAEIDPTRTLSEEETIDFCKHASCIGMLQTRSLAEEVAGANLADVDMEDEDSKQSPLIWYFLLRAVHRFIAEFNKYPGVHEGHEYEQDAKWLVQTAQLLAASATTSEPFPVDWISLDHGREVCRHAEAEVHNIAAILGGIASQEAVKIITNQFTPINHTYLFNGITGRANTYQF
ncbi:hypothetical protein SPRG_21242 [Saprolegnia parasitica CBS 223.65]|uniref:NEDD8-activating enzyme E1 regulatory subunit n=1 Tax=Saprolegnia parasitica (strain CBS 223.65) TaxID=695850 RepID=A0A067C5A9_SAPPC|nr:hypothetical protein SPRG_21242 [Saprolegnia parasitica CBS 223.65]KDO21711.1 hypothetical protein SPRG_21242 [Saprolegnia parasitica CBS 223.65]|eukprot:XP_012207578.1 hypothetical protein SPRG_21242 [Saprolegnia parasitica CBS 223.65]